MASLRSSTHQNGSFRRLPSSASSQSLADVASGVRRSLVDAFKPVYPSTPPLGVENGESNPRLPSTPSFLHPHPTPPPPPPPPKEERTMFAHCPPSPPPGTKGAPHLHPSPFVEAHKSLWRGFKEDGRLSPMELSGRRVLDQRKLVLG